MRTETLLKEPTKAGATMTPSNDLALLQAIARQRDPQAFAQLFATHGPSAHSLARNITRDPEAAAEAVQEAMLRVWEAAPRFKVQEGGSVRSWLLRIVARESLLQLRSQRQARSQKARLMTQQKPEKEPTPAGGLEHEDLLAALRDVVNRLPEYEQRLLALYFGGGLSHEEIGQHLNVPRRTIAHQVEASIQRLRGALSHAGFAAAAPGVGAELLNEALCSGHALPASLSARVLENLTLPVRESLKASRRVAATGTKGHGLLLPSGLLLAAAAAVAFWWTAGSKPAAPLTLAQTPSEPQLVLPPTPVEPTVQPFFRRWDFNTPEQAEDFKVLKGSWHHLPEGGPDGSGCMEADSKILELYFTKPPAHSLFTFTLVTSSRALDTTLQDVNLNLDEKVTLDFAISRERRSTFSNGPRTDWTPGNSFFAESFFIETDELGLSFLSCFKERFQFEGFTIRFESQQVGLRIDNIAFRSIRPDEVPDISHYKREVACIPVALKKDGVLLKLKNDPLHTQGRLFLRLCPDEALDSGLFIKGVRP